jgi:hypothetical protein
MTEAQQVRSVASKVPSSPPYLPPWPVAYPMRKGSLIGARTLGGQKKTCQAKKLLRCKSLSGFLLDAITDEQCRHSSHRGVLCAQKRLFARAFVLSNGGGFASDGTFPEVKPVPFPIKRQRFAPRDSPVNIICFLRLRPLPGLKAGTGSSHGEVMLPTHSYPLWGDD